MRVRPGDIMPVSIAPGPLATAHESRISELTARSVKRV
jgi:hypothetical protein